MLKKNSNTTTVIGFVTHGLLDGYSMTIWETIVQTCKQRNVHCHCFAGGELKSPVITQAARNKIYRLIGKKIVNGIIISSTTVFHYVGEDELHAFYNKYHGLPMVNIGYKVKSIPTVSIDNTEGLRQGIRHLIEDHEYKKIAIIRGPKNNNEAIQRYNTYKETLEEYDIEVNPKLIRVGNFSNQDGAACFEEIMKQNKHIDAVVCANDGMALGALMKAGELGLLIPNDLAIMGFDDILQARSAMPPLTTVRQPLEKLAKKATEMLVDIIENNKAGEDIILPTELVIRRSCGCFSNAITQAAATDENKEKRKPPVPLKQHNNADRNFTDNIMEEQHATHSLTLREQLRSSLMTHIKTEGKTMSFLSAIDRLLKQDLLHQTDSLNEWQNALSDLRRTVLPQLKHNIPRMIDAENFFHQIRVLMQEIMVGYQTYVGMKIEQRTILLQEVSGSIIRNFNLKDLLDILSDELPRLGIESCYLSLYERTQENREFSNLIFAYHENQRIDIPAQGIRFKTAFLLPEDVVSLRKLNNFIIESIFYQQEQFGYIIFKVNLREGVLEGLRQQISSALKGALLVQEVKDKENKLQELLEDQKVRAQELENAYKALQENQQKMLIIDKMASLGRMTAGISHEINTPLAAIRASIVELESLAKEYTQSIEDKEVTADDHREIAREIGESLAIAKKAAERAAGFVQSIKLQTRDLAAKDHHEFNIIPVIKDAILLLDHDLRKNNCSVSLQYKKHDIKLSGSEGRLAQIITNLLNNAIDACKSKGGGVITVELTEDASGVDLNIQDRGVGIKHVDILKIFDPMFTTKAFGEGMGLGLTIVHDIVYGDFGGTIEVKSNHNVGTTFMLHFPKPREGVKHGQKI